MSFAAVRVQYSRYKPSNKSAVRSNNTYRSRVIKVRNAILSHIDKLFLYSPMYIRYDASCLPIRNNRFGEQSGGGSERQLVLVSDLSIKGCFVNDRLMQLQQILHVLHYFFLQQSLRFLKRQTSKWITCS